MSDPSPTEASPPTYRRHGRRWWIVVLVALGVLFAWSAISLVLSATALRDGRAALGDARRDLTAGDLDGAGASFDAAAAAFDRAAGANGWGPSFIPFLGDDHDAVAAIAEAGAHLAAAGDAIVDGLTDVPGGLDGLAPSDQGLPLEAYAGLAGALTTAADEAGTAARAIADAPSSYLLPPVADARWDAQAETERFADALGAAADLAAGLPSFAGADGPKRYLVLSANPSELRGTGGIWGAYAILTMRDGKASLSGAAPTKDLPDVTNDELEGIDPHYRELYDSFGGAASWQNMNMTPDFPTAARAALANLAAGGAAPLDGVISADPQALASLMRVTGAVEVPGTGRRVGADDVVAFTTNEAYSAFSGSAERKEVLGALAADVLGRFLSMDGRTMPRVRALGDAVTGGNLKVYATDPDFQAALERAGATGAFARPEGADQIAVTVNNGSANKVDYYATRTVDATIQLGGDHEAFGSLDVAIANDAPTEGLPRYVLGPFVEDLGPGDQFPLISAWCADPCELLEARRDGQDTLVNADVEEGMAFFRDYRPIAAGERGTFGIGWHTTDAWEGEAGDGTYRLSIPGQPTIRPTEATVTIVAPPGSDIAWTSEPMAVDGDRATWSGMLQGDTVLEVRFRASFLTRWWHSLTGD